VGTNRIFIFAMLLTLTNISSLSLKHMDAVLIGKYLSLDSVAVYAVAAYIALVIEIPLISMERITHAKVSEAWAQNDTGRIFRIYSESVRYLMLAGGLLLTGIVANIEDLLSLLRPVYHTGVTVAIIACIGGFLNIASGVNTSILFTSSKYLYGTFLLLFLLVLAIVLNLVLIPRFGIEGAAAATAIATGIYNIVKYLIILKHFRMQPFDLSSLKIVLIILITFGLVFLLPDIEGNAFARMALRSTLICIVYLGLAYLLKIAPELLKRKNNLF
jgi:O-antigen/teichoic acid export membrane protein